MILVGAIALLGSLPAWGAIQPTVTSARLEALRTQSAQLEEELGDSLREQKNAKANLARIRKVLALHREEKRVATQRMQELERALSELENRRVLLNERIAGHQQQVRDSIEQLLQSRHEAEAGAAASEATVQLAKRKILERLASRSLREVEAYRVDLADSERLEQQIQAERQQLQYLAQDLNEREGVMELSRQLQADILQKRRAERAEQLRSYRELKRTEAQVETLMKGFQARLELEKSEQAEREMHRGLFARLKGSLSFPTIGPVVSFYGQARDEKSKLNVFKKGIEIKPEAGAGVSAIAPGKVAFSGQVPGIGLAVIIDHGDHLYSISGRLGDLRKKSGEFVAAGESVGIADSAGNPVYFEIRDRNIPVNPLPWLKQ
jgi:septal ring factor EnvC (AmiA/AmiB activator)